MHEGVLSDEQVKLLPLVAEFSGEYGLVGGTAVALQLGHRRSVDFDMVTLGELKNESIVERIKKNYPIQKSIVDGRDELTVVVESVKLTFLRYPFAIDFAVNLDNKLRVPDVKTLAAMKGYALGRRAKWKDYVDLYFIFRKHTLGEVVKTSKDIFADEFSEKQFREQLSYFEDIDYSETIDYLEGMQVSDEEIKKTLTEISLQKDT